jgi:hypothetical protein
MRPKATSRDGATGQLRSVALPIVLFLAALPVACDADWKNKPSSQWTVDDALKVVQKSPWAREVVVSTPRYVADRMRREAAQRENSPNLPAGAEAGPSESNAPRHAPTGAGTTRPTAPTSPTPRQYVAAAYLVRWETARPVVEAFARLRALGEETSAAFQSPAPRLLPDRYVITVKTTHPATWMGMDIFYRLKEEQLREAARLKTKRGLVAPIEIERSGIGASAATHFYFPREYEGKPLLAQKKETVEFQFQALRFRLKSKFKLEMEYVR